MARWECRDLGDVKEFLRMRIRRHGSTIEIDQCAYLDKVLDRCGMADCKPISVPLDQNGKVSADVGVVLEDPTMYRKMVGGLFYATINRPNLSYVVGLLSQFM